MRNKESGKHNCASQSINMGEQAFSRRYKRKKERKTIGTERLKKKITEVELRVHHQRSSAQARYQQEGLEATKPSLERGNKREEKKERKSALIAVHDHHHHHHQHREGWWSRIKGK